MQTTRIKIAGLTCEGCVASTRRALQGVAGVGAINVSLADGRATVEHGEEVRAQDLLLAVIDAGYEARLERG